MTYQVTRAADDDPDVMHAVLTAIVARSSYDELEPGYYVELEGEPGEVLGAGFLSGYDPATGEAILNFPERDQHGNVGEPTGRLVRVDANQVTQMELP